MNPVVIVYKFKIVKGRYNFKLWIRDKMMGSLMLTKIH